MRLKPLIITLWALALAAVAWYVYVSLADPDNSPTQQTAGRSLIGGDFSLTNHLGETVTDADFRGQHMLVFFGYTYCPDICPLELQSMTQAIDMLDERGVNTADVQPIFITIDPERDDVEAMANYVSLFHPKLVGLTGSREEINKAARAYRVYSAKSQGSGDGGQDYLMDHSTFVYLMGPEGDYITHFPAGTQAPEMAQSLEDHLS